MRTLGGGLCPEGITGTVRMPDPFMLELCPGEWDGCQRIMKDEKGCHVWYYVEFDDGPYVSSEVLVDHLEPLSE